MGNGQWEIFSCPMPYAPCPMPYAPCPTPQNLEGTSKNACRNK
ncbi:hypothetical protein [Tolypothrix sp. VBCCA 56010]